MITDIYKHFIMQVVCYTAKNGIDLHYNLAYFIRISSYFLAT